MVPSRSTAMMISGELSTRRCKYLGSSGSIKSWALIIQLSDRGSALPSWRRSGRARTKLGEHHFVAHLLKRHFDRHPDADFVRLDADQVGDKVRPLFEFHYDYRVGHFAGKTGMIDLVHYIVAVNFPASADRNPFRPRGHARGTEA